MITEYLDILRAFKYSHAEEYNISRIGIFGSVVRGEQTDISDIDIYYDGPALGLSASVKLLTDLENIFQRPVDIVRKHKNLKPAFVQHIEKEVIYAE